MTLVSGEWAGRDVWTERRKPGRLYRKEEGEKQGAGGRGSQVVSFV